MSLKDDKNLEELTTKLSLHCKAKNYTLVTSIMNDDDLADGNVLACNGDIAELALNICCFAKSIESRFKMPFRHFLVKALIDSFNFDEDKKYKN